MPMAGVIKIAITYFLKRCRGNMAAGIKSNPAVNNNSRTICTGCFWQNYYSGDFFISRYLCENFF